MYEYVRTRVQFEVFQNRIRTFPQKAAVEEMTSDSRSAAASSLPCGVARLHGAFLTGKNQTCCSLCTIDAWLDGYRYHGLHQDHHRREGQEDTQGGKL